MAPDHDIRELVDAFLRADKWLTGVGRWQPESGVGKQRLVRPIEVAGELQGQELTVKAYPTAPTLKFRIVLTMGRAIWRLDYMRDEIHLNPISAPRDITSGLIRGPHYHAWRDNRHLSTPHSLPRRLGNARLLNPRIRRFEQAFRWFCAETNINLGPADVPDLPRPDTFL